MSFFSYDIDRSLSMLNYSADMSYRQSLKFPMQQSRGITLLCPLLSQAPSETCASPNGYITCLICGKKKDGFGTEMFSEAILVEHIGSGGVNYLLVGNFPLSELTGGFGVKVLQ